MISSGTSLIRPPCAGRRAHRAPTGSPRVVHGGGPADRYRRGCAPRTATVSSSTPAPRGRLAALVAAVVTAIVVLVGGVSAVDGDGRVDAGAPGAVVTAEVRERHVAAPGDSLWSIAEQYRGSVGHAAFLDVLIDLNGGTAIEVGQAVWLP